MSWPKSTTHVQHAADLHVRGRCYEFSHEEKRRQMPQLKTICLVEMAELLGVSKQRAHQLADERGFPAPISRDGRGLCLAACRAAT